MLPAAGAVVVYAQGCVLLVKRCNEPKNGRRSLPGDSIDPARRWPMPPHRRLSMRPARPERSRAAGKDRADRDGLEFEIRDFLAPATSRTFTPGNDADDARWIAPAGCDGLPLTNGLPDCLERASLILPA